jgi:arginine-tRNA-protein transferase
MQTEIRQGQELIAVGFLDRGNDCLSSVYFCFDPAWIRLSLGIFGALQELSQARFLGMDWYYLGYYVPGCPRMAYQDHFRPRQHFHWGRGEWRTVDAFPGGGEFSPFAD